MVLRIPKPLLWITSCECGVWILGHLKTWPLSTSGAFTGYSDTYKSRALTALGNLLLDYQVLHSSPPGTGTVSNTFRKAEYILEKWPGCFLHTPPTSEANNLQCALLFSSVRSWTKWSPRFFSSTTVGCDWICMHPLFMLKKYMYFTCPCSNYMF